MSELFLLTMLLGAIAGLLAGLFGLGGGVIIVPALAWLFTVQSFPHEVVMIMAVATSLASIIPTALSAIMSHYRLGTIIWTRVFRLSPSILVGAAMGAVIASEIEGSILNVLFISYLLYVGFKMAMPTVISNVHSKFDDKIDYPVGLGIGVVSSILGIGGGSLTVPYLLGRQVAIKNAVAISSVCGLPIAISGTLVYVALGAEKLGLPEWSVGYVYLPALLGIVICSVLTAPVGARLANRLPAKKLKRYFSLVIFAIALKMMVIF